MTVGDFTSSPRAASGLADIFRGEDFQCIFAAATLGSGEAQTRGFTASAQQFNPLHRMFIKGPIGKTATPPTPQHPIGRSQAIQLAAKITDPFQRPGRQVHLPPQSSVLCALFLSGPLPWV